MNEVKFVKHVKLFEELAPYKEYFDCALQYVYEKHHTDKQLFCVDYAPRANPKSKMKRIQIKHDVAFYTNMYEELKARTNKNHTVLINNILSTLIGIPIMKYIKSHKIEE
jgi:hypothetical protein